LRHVNGERIVGEVAGHDKTIRHKGPFFERENLSVTNIKNLLLAFFLISKKAINCRINAKKKDFSDSCAIGEKVKTL